MRVALIGWGAINQTVASMITDRSPADGSPIEIVAVAVRQHPDVPLRGLPSGARILTNPSQLATLSVDVVAEAASRDSVKPWGRAALQSGADFVVSSVSAFADHTLLDSLRRLAATTSTQIIVQPGALGGIDALSAARPLGLDRVEHRIVKPPAAWKNTPAEALCHLDSLVEPEVFYSANAAETAAQFPKNANVAMTTALAGVGPEATVISLVADPSIDTNQHLITASGPFGRLAVTIENNPLPANPKTSGMAAYNLARTIMNRVNPIVL